MQLFCTLNKIDFIVGLGYLFQNAASVVILFPKQAIKAAPFFLQGSMQPCTGIKITSALILKAMPNL